MSLPPNVTQTAFDSAVKAWRLAVGPEWVFTEPADVALYRDAYSPFYGEAEERVASAAVAPVPKRISGKIPRCPFHDIQGPLSHSASSQKGLSREICN